MGPAGGAARLWLAVRGARGERGGVQMGCGVCGGVTASALQSMRKCPVITPAPGEPAKALPASRPPRAIAQRACRRDPPAMSGRQGAVAVAAAAAGAAAGFALGRGAGDLGLRRMLNGNFRWMSREVRGSGTRAAGSWTQAAGHTRQGGARRQRFGCATGAGSAARRPPRRRARILMPAPPRAPPRPRPPGAPPCARARGQRPGPPVLVVAAPRRARRPEAPPAARRGGAPRRGGRRAGGCEAAGGLWGWGWVG
jgi:hypothetical protein